MPILLLKLIFEKIKFTLIFCNLTLQDIPEKRITLYGPKRLTERRVTYEKGCQGKNITSHQVTPEGPLNYQSPIRAP